MKLAEIKIIVPQVKPRNPNQKVLANKANAAGKHVDKKAQQKQGFLKHKSKMYEEGELE